MFKVVPLIVIVVVLMACQPGPTTVEATVEVPVTVEVTSEVTRIVEVQVTSEVTRLVETTRIVQITPKPGDTPVPTPTPEVLSTAANFLVGNFDLNQLSKAEEGSATVIASGPINSGDDMPIIANNNTRRPIESMAGSAIVRAADGSLLGTGEIQYMFPVYVLPGGWTIGELEFNESMPLDAGFEINLTFDEITNDTFFKDVEIVEHNIVGNRLVGFLLNSSGVTLENIAVVYTCLDESLNPLNYDQSYIDQDTVLNGQQAAFDAELEGECPRYLVAARGFEP